jgi:hypothetical protein
MEGRSFEFGGSLPDQRSVRKNPLSIAMLFYILTLAAIVAACLGKLSVTEGVTRSTVVAAVVVGSVVGLLVGSLGGGFYFSSIKAALIGLVVGLFLGAVGGALTIITGEHSLEMLTIAFAGCWLIIVLMLVAARFQTG